MHFISDLHRIKQENSMIDLMNKTSVSVELECISEKLIKDGDITSADRLHQLALAVNGGMYADAWSLTDVHQMIDVDTIIERYKNYRGTERLISCIEWTRNTLI